MISTGATDRQAPTAGQRELDVRSKICHSGPVALYLDWFDGIRAYYERKYGMDGEPGFCAAAALAGLAATNAINAMLTYDGLQCRSPAGHFVSKPVMAAVAIAIEIAHFKGAESHVLCKRLGPPRNCKWAVTFRLYLAATLGWSAAAMGWIYLVIMRC